MAAEAAMRQTFSTLRSFIGDRRGLAAIEFAVIVPVLVLAYFGTVDIANWYMAHRRLVVAGSTIADLTTQSPGQTSKAEISDFWNGIGDIIKPLKLSDVTLTMRAFRMNGTSVQPLWPYSSGGGGSCSIDPSAAELQSMGTNEMSDGNDILVAAVCTTVSPIALQMFGFTAIPLRYQISMRPRLGKTLDCSSC
jgi:Flp pilus assembly protein TadG